MISALFVFAAFGQLAPIKLPPPKPVPVLVVDEKGKPVEGAEVFLAGLSLHGAGLEFRVAHTAKTDGRGRCVLDPSAQSAELQTDAWIQVIEIWAYRPPYALGGRRLTASPLPSAGEPYEVVLKSAAPCSVRILGPDGNSIAGARVTVDSQRNSLDFPDHLPSSLSLRLAAMTDAKGLATFRDFVSEEINSIDVTCDGYGEQSWSLGPGGVQGVPEIRLRATGRLVGRVVIDDLAQVRGQSVTGTTRDTSKGGRITSGRFAAPLQPDGTFEVAELASGTLTILPFLNLRLRPPYREEPRPSVAIKSGEEAKVEITVSRGKAKRVHGSVVERGSGRPIEGVAVMLASSGEPGRLVRGSARTWTDSDGRFECVLPPGHIRSSTGMLRQSLPYMFPLREPVPEADLRDDQDELDFPRIELICAGSVAGAVRDERKRPVARAVVEVCMPDRLVSKPTIRWLSVLTNAKGEFRIDGLPPDVEIRLSARSGVAATAQAETTRATAEPKPLELVISPANTYYAAGRVVDEAGKPVKGAAIEIYENADFPAGFASTRNYSLEQGWQITTDAQGRYRTPSALNKESYFGVTVRAQGYEPATLRSQKGPGRLDLPFPDAALKKQGGAKPNVIGSAGLVPLANR